MKKIRLPLMIQDVRVAYEEELPDSTENIITIQENLMDGPITDRVAIIDIDPVTGKLHPGVKLIEKKKVLYYTDQHGKQLTEYKDAELYKPEFLQTSIFATILKTLDLFEKNSLSNEDSNIEEVIKNKYGLLGKEIKWAFKDDQLFVFPRAGEMSNAFYNRDTHSLEFFYFKDSENKTVFSGLSREIVAHETGHAIIDAIAPDILNSYTPQSLAIHEGLADLVALFLSFSSSKLGVLILDQNDGSIRNESHFTNLAEEFAQGAYGEPHLRNFLNQKSLIEDSANFVSSNEPHELCEVFIGAMYDVITNYHDRIKKSLIKQKRFQKFDYPMYSASGEALALCHQRIRRILFRGLDFLPPGEITYEDYGRAIVAADRLESPKYPHVRNDLVKQFIKRGMATTKKDLKEDVLRKTKIKVDISKFVNNSKYATTFIDSQKQLFLIPKNTSYKIERIEIVTYHDKVLKDKKVCIAKISWQELEENNLGDARIADQREIKLGTTLIIEMESLAIISRLSNTVTSKVKGDKIKASRDAFLKHLIKEGKLKLDNAAIGMDGLPLQNAVTAVSKNGILRIKGTGKSLHLC